MKNLILAVAATLCLVSPAMAQCSDDSTKCAVPESVVTLRAELEDYREAVFANLESFIEYANGSLTDESVDWLNRNPEADGLVSDTVGTQVQSIEALDAAIVLMGGESIFEDVTVDDNGQGQ